MQTPSVTGPSTGTIIPTPSANSAPPKSNPSIQPEAYDQPEVDDLFDGSKPNFGQVYNKYMAAKYYGDVTSISDPGQRTAELRKLVAESHKPDPKGYHYVIAKNLYTKVDRHPDGTVRSVYNKEPVKFLQYPDISLDTLSEKDLSAIAGASMSSPEVIGAWLGFQRGAAELNCEHVVPQSFFNKAEPMRSDLHHLYACNIGDNSRRGATPYPNYTPKGGKGEVARATLYFMLRYPDIKLPYKSNAVATLKEWSANDPPDDHERHRNKEIQQIQGNRNPFIDHPEWLKDFQP